LELNYCRAELPGLAIGDKPRDPLPPESDVAELVAPPLDPGRLEPLIAFLGPFGFLRILPSKVPLSRRLFGRLGSAGPFGKGRGKEKGTF
jgi:hypothetical protein